MSTYQKSTFSEDHISAISWCTAASTLDHTILSNNENNFGP